MGYAWRWVAFTKWSPCALYVAQWTNEAWFLCEKTQALETFSSKLLNSANFFFFSFFFFFFFFFRAAGAVYGSSMARGQIGAVPSSLQHSHSNAGSLTHWAGPGIEPTSSWILIVFVSAEPQWELLLICFDKLFSPSSSSHNPWLYC